ncbi:hypothetical protein STA1M1_33190 [Sinisalibacter aestuarii]|uniref:Uncharacterized protein n=2 Tax=Sinisalibacter aestuarii TaxID=2949426 RepID=A0ABQ5LWT9_9RHOB|nr:hypothetical protein STA1M1_33190 [Sinisalibacter aestuarii]
MPTNVVEFPFAAHPTTPVGQYIRLGETAYQRLGSMLVEGRLPATRVVVDASRISHQREIIRAFKAAGAEVVMDTKAAELAAHNKFGGWPKHAPWGAMNPGGPIGPEFFAAKRADDIFGEIARCAVEFGVDAVLAPGHFINAKDFDGWFEVDRRSCEYLREALDREGGSSIGIDYLLVTKHTEINDAAKRSEFVAGLDGLPFDNLWLRASGFGNDAGPLAAARFLSALHGLHNLGKPIISDYLGGLVGEAAVAFGAVSGLAHGIGERERFSASGWEKPPAPRDGQKGGSQKRVSVPGLNRSLSVPEFEVMCSARGGKRLLVCPDRKVCPNGIGDMIADTKRVAAHEALTHLATIAAVPDQRRADHFLEHRVKEVDRNARQVKNLKPKKEEAEQRGVDLERLLVRLADHSDKIGKMRSAFEHMHEEKKDRPHRARPVCPRRDSGTDIEIGQKS